MREGSPYSVPALAAALNDEEPLDRGHAAWPLGRIPDARSADTLRARPRVEEDEWVIAEIRSSLDED
ncbi:MAG TPA: HEAT repeat domain-containing protein [Longimicrobium sp.]|nr:HEAT repeat domain-containing protein [Longimicrobium sp.]